ncbi:unnamed protein product [Heligmosomoides polygyrus]|uniref:HTH CENPB-type domain-containing protein n=1 Tax=Heligmosomoides polygyrus TaxID=6339 RepID=A0A183FI39_HELPZ|nr:unnamed protein product [Heligmosomoides polygyrus]
MQASRKRPRSDVKADASPSNAKELCQSTESGRSNSTDLTDTAFQLFSNKSPSNTITMDSGYQMDPVKQLMEQSDKEMSVKEALAKGFRNYKVRLPKKRIQFDADSSIDTSVLYSLFANDAVDENGKEPSAAAPNPPASVHDAPNEREVQTETNPAAQASAEKSDADTDMDASVKREPIESPVGTHVPLRAASPDVVNERSCVYTLPPFWKLPLVVSKGYRGGYYVRGVKYVQMTTLIHYNALAVPLDAPIRFDIDGEAKTFTFDDLLLANGVAINDPRKCAEISKIFATSVLLVHHSIAEHLLCNAGPNPLNPHARLKLDCDPIPISGEFPPIACHKPQYFALALNRCHGANEIFDPCKPNVPSSGLSEALPIFEDTKPCIEEAKPSQSSPRVDAPLTARQKGLVLTHFDTGASIDELAEKFRVSAEDIENIILNRAEVVRDQTAALIADTDMDDEKDSRPVVICSGARKKNRVRRTSFVGLNILMWRFFKDCRDNGIVLNGKLLKEHAMMISRQLGLENFKGSEGWLDAFKRRHRIDLKLMSGVPVNYEETDDDKMEEDHEDNHSSASANVATSTRQLNISQIQASSDGTTAALLDSVEKASAPRTMAPIAHASISNTKPLDLANLFGVSESSSADRPVARPCADASPGSSSRVSPGRVTTQLSPTLASDERGLIAAIVKSAAIRVPDKEVSSALETIRSYILTNDASAMPVFLELQMKLAVLSREQSKRERRERAYGVEQCPAQNGGCLSFATAILQWLCGVAK